MYRHGLHPGYYLSMLTTTPCILAESLMEREFKLEYLSTDHYKYYDFAVLMFRSREFEYMSLGFILLRYDLTMRFWSSVYFIGHAFCALMIVFALVLKCVRLMKRKTHKMKSN